MMVCLLHYHKNAEHYLVARDNLWGAEILPSEHERIMQRSRCLWAQMVVWFQGLNALSSDFGSLTVVVARQ